MISFNRNREAGTLFIIETFNCLLFLPFQEIHK